MNYKILILSLKHLLLSQTGDMKYLKIRNPINNKALKSYTVNCSPPERMRSRAEFRSISP
jgi:hypothetical protein